MKTSYMHIVKNALVLCFLILQIAVQAKIEETPFTEYTYNPKSCQGIRHGSGSQIFIPDNAFVLKKNGQVCGDKIKIKYREFHSQADMVANNIPMNFLQDKQNKQLESGGMFQILAECNGQDLELAKGKQIQVRFASKNDIENLDAFYFDEKKGWELLNTPVTDFSVRTTMANAELWGNTPPNVNIAQNIETVKYSVEVTETTIVNNGLPIVNTEYNEMQSLFSKAPGVFKGMNIDKMGLYNYDRVLCADGSVPFAVNFKIKGSEEKVTTKVYVAYAGINTVVYYVPDDWNERFALLPRKDIRIFTLLDDGRVAQLPQSVLNNLNLQSLRKKNHTFELEISNIKPENKQQLASVTGITN